MNGVTKGGTEDRKIYIVCISACKADVRGSERREIDISIQCGERSATAAGEAAMCAGLAVRRARRGGRSSSACRLF